MKKKYVCPACRIFAIHLAQVITGSEEEKTKIGISDNKIEGRNVLTNRRDAWGCSSWPDVSSWGDGDK